MDPVSAPVQASIESSSKINKSKWLKRLYKERYLYIMSIPFVIWLVIFKYIPIWGWIMAFQEFRPGKGIFGSKWVGLQQFSMMFKDDQFFRALRNTVAMSVLSLIAGFTCAILFALLINEVSNIRFKRSIQTVSYLPHFVSWVIVAGMFSKLLSTDGGVINTILVNLGLLKEPVQFMAKDTLFWPISTIIEAWKETGWNSIIYLAAIAGINPELFEAAFADGAGRLRKIWHIILPSIRPTIIILLVMNVGWLVSSGFEKQFLLGNNLVVDYSQVLSIYVLQYGISMARFSYGTAVGIFQSVVSIILLFLASKAATKFGEGSLV